MIRRSFPSSSLRNPKSTCVTSSTSSAAIDRYVFFLKPLPCSFFLILLRFGCYNRSVSTSHLYHCCSISDAGFTRCEFIVGILAFVLVQEGFYGIEA
uniref:Uncharacterized protein n=1 Tax=Helianthus annuus TaxID=4232 RepID=A0A251THQ4_HELAN